MEPTSNQPYPGYTSPTTPSYSGNNPATAGSQFSTTAAHATGEGKYPTDYPSTQPADDSVQGKLNSALDSGKKWLNDSGIIDQAQQLPQAAKDLSNKAWTRISGLTNTQKAVGVGLLAAGVAFLATRSKGSKHDESEYRHKPRRSPFEKSGRDDFGHGPRGAQQRPWGSSRYGSAAGNSRVSSGSGYTSSPAPYGNEYDSRHSSSQHGADYGGRYDSPSQHSADYGSRTSSDRSASMGSSSYGAGQRRDQGPTSGSRYDAKTSGGQNPNNLDQLNSAF